MDTSAMAHSEAGERDGSLERGLVATVVGLVAAVLVIIMLEPVLQSLYPRLEVNPLGAAERPPASDALPATSLLLLLGAYGLASVVGGLAASLTSGRARAWPAVVTGLILMIAGSYAVIVVDNPPWFRIASFATYPLAYVGHLLVRRAS
jgi:hypothetical protein